MAEQLVEMVGTMGESVVEGRSKVGGSLRIKGRSVVRAGNNGRLVVGHNNGSSRLGKSLLLWWNPSLLLSN